MAGYYVISCGDLSYLTDESKALTEFKPDALVDRAKDRADDTISGLETGELPDMSGVDIQGSHGAITSLYAGTSSDAGDFNGKVCSLHPGLDCVGNVD
jgi:hypothetical protein